MTEEWKTIQEAPDCEISNFGNVRIKERTIITSNGKSRTYKSHIIVANKKKTGYLEVALPIEKGKRIYRLIHRLVLMTFKPCSNMENLEVNHIDENKENNCIDNLEWVTSKENCNYGNRNQKISKNSQKRKVRCIETNTIYDSIKEAQEATGICKSSICEVCQGKRFYTRNKQKGPEQLHWEYVDESN